MRIHGPDALRHFGRHVVTGRFLHSQLAVVWRRHLRPVPVETALVIVDLVEEMDFDGHHGDLRVQIQHFQQRPRPAFPHADDEQPRQSPLDRRLVVVIVAADAGFLRRRRTLRFGRRRCWNWATAGHKQITMRMSLLLDAIDFGIAASSSFSSSHVFVLLMDQEADGEAGHYRQSGQQPAANKTTTHKEKDGRL